MKINKSQRTLNDGMIVYLVVVIMGIIGIFLGSYLRLVSQQHYSVARSQAWNEAIPVAEAGLEEALAEINSGFSGPKLVGNGWHFDGTQFLLKRNLGDNYYTVAISNTLPPVITSSGFVRLPRSRTDYVDRTIRVRTHNPSLYTKAMVARGQIDLRGNNITADSFDSDDPLFSTSGMYDPTKRKANGDIATNSGLTNSLDVGNANIFGKVATGPGGSISVGDNGVVGDLAFHASGAKGIQTGYSSDDMNVDFPDVESPFNSGLSPVMVTGLDGTNYITINSGDYYMDRINLTGNKTKILVTGSARLYVAGDIDMSGSSEILIQTGGSLKLFGAGESTNIGGNGVVNQTGLAANFQYFGLPTNKQVSFTGNADWIGTIYAPQAALELGGGGRTIWDFTGASVSDTVTMNGHFNFHYDEALGKMDNGDIYKVISWNEI